MTCSGGSLRMQARMAVEARIGSSPVMRAAAGVTAATGSGANRMIARPTVAFQKPITDQGKVTANSTTSRKSAGPKPPADNAAASSQTRPTIDSPTSVKKAIRRPVGGERGRQGFVRDGTFQHGFHFLHLGI